MPGVPEPFIAEQRALQLEENARRGRQVLPVDALPSLTLALACDHSRGAPHPNLDLTGRLRKELIHYLE